MSIRTEKVASLIQQELGKYLSKELHGNSLVGFVTVTEVRMTPDLRVARVYISVFGSDEQKVYALKYLENQRPQLRSFIGSVVHLRFTPELHLYHDTSLDNAQHIEELIKQIHKDDKDIHQ
ncbi:MAG: 30S ribosome-binding factor RbfA [Bacteroidetes bacterium]|nr:30S ribosome-binding factor RbfA [Bacteroidota bacterium]